MGHLVQVVQLVEGRDPVAYAVRYRDPVTHRNTEPSQLSIKAIFPVAKHGVLGARLAAEELRKRLDDEPESPAEA